MLFFVFLRSELDHVAGLCCKAGWESRWLVFLALGCSWCIRDEYFRAGSVSFKLVL